MKKSIKLISFILVFISTLFLLDGSKPGKNIESKFYPNDWFFTQRSYPYNDIPVEKYYTALYEKENMISKNMDAAATSWYPVGPSNIGGRITTLDYDPNNNWFLHNYLNLISFTPIFIQELTSNRGI